MIEVTPSGQACGATVTGVDLSKALDAATIRAVRAAWLEHHVLAFPDQALADADLERFVQSFGVFGSEPFFLPMAGSEHIVALTRMADEKAPLFAENWHSDWSFLAEPPMHRMACTGKRIGPQVAVWRFTFQMMPETLNGTRLSSVTRKVAGRPCSAVSAISWA